MRGAHVTIKAKSSNAWQAAANQKLLRCMSWLYRPRVMAAGRLGYPVDDGYLHHSDKLSTEEAKITPGAELEPVIACSD
ncbi:hypothetical protein [Aquicella siphonis]|uniref:hypothetical protein n=1 Tax=Aquicella siphonis TaxID=254247 RepID=UPI00155AF328|nr:hypothetical protein [Aquicella siphonis]